MNAQAKQPTGYPARGGKADDPGSRFGHRGYFLQPTVFVDMNRDMKVVREEIFGPIVTAMPFDDPREIGTKPTTGSRSGSGPTT
jgi:acyl-CoA reductase-like NAD-dependent aldehyde dehydrogenase